MHQHWVEFEESGELQKVYLQREDHVETKRVSHGKTLKNLTASPGDPLSSAPASVADSTPKPDAEQEVQASDMEISIVKFGVGVPTKLMDAHDATQSFV